MGFNCGIVGLPNVGKSTLFNALTATAAAEAANYPFTTVDPNSGFVTVPDPRLDEVARLAASAKIVPTRMAFVDIAGLVAGASRGEGLGNQFLGHIREVDAIAHVVRCFADDDVSHVANTIDPARDMETISTELMLADLESVERRLDPLIKKVRGGDKEAAAEVAIMEPARDALADGRPARSIAADEGERRRLARLGLLTAKPVLYVFNVDEDSAAEGNAYSEAAAACAAQEGASSIVVSAAIEAEVSQLTDADERREFLDSLGLAESGLARLIRAGYALLGLITYFTASEKEARAWTVPAGATAWDSAGVIHTDFQKGFIRAETIDYDDLLSCGGMKAASDAGKMRAEGRDYVVHDGDIIHFRFNV
jgi:ribosome-binding ATPase